MHYPIKDLKTADKLIFIFIILYFLSNMFYLDSFPFVHSDEAWLASLTRSMIIEKNPAATEEFFRITERDPHAVKTLFHLLQIPFVLSDYSVKSVRLLSLIGSVLSLIFIYLFLRRILKHPVSAALITVIIALDIQYVYISRFARQEILFLLSSSIQLFFIHDFLSRSNKKSLATAGIVSGLSIFIHPNSFIIFIGIVFYGTAFIFLEKRGEEKIKTLLDAVFCYGGISLGFFISAAAVSLFMNPDFLSAYLQSGAQHGTGDPMLVKIISFPRFLYKIIHRIQGTYYLPDIRFQLYFFAASLLFFLILLIFQYSRGRKLIPPLMLAAGTITGIVLIGKYSPPSIVFLTVPAWIFSGLAVSAAADFVYSVFLSRRDAGEAAAVLIFTAALIVNLVNTAGEFLTWKNYSYEAYGRVIRENAGSEGRVFANTGTAFFLDYGRLCAYRDLAVLEEKKLSFRDYILQNNIKTIIWSEELDIIAAERPVWNTMYGNVYSYYNDAKLFIDNECVETARFSMKLYPVRIVYKMLQRKYDMVFYSCSISE